MSVHVDQQLEGSTLQCADDGLLERRVGREPEVEERREERVERLVGRVGGWASAGVRK